ncbi:MAG TPA: TMEM175 family protein, partial [Cyclobacteriaceae bacterium]|nr:TMEM175 family protein [Cyclobacteriaceae bacterium]
MIRESLINNSPGKENEFRNRGTEPGRLENFSDAVFALVITLLLISTSPPTNFAQIKHFVYELLPFLICIALIIVIWKEHYTFFLRYGLRDGRMIVLNTLFLIIVLFYVYPLKFLTRLILIPIAYLTDNQTMFDTFTGMIAGQDIGDLMIIYGTGAACVFFVLMMMYRYALKQAKMLALNDVEIFDTKVSIR